MSLPEHIRYLATKTGGLIAAEDPEMTSEALHPYARQLARESLQTLWDTAATEEQIEAMAQLIEVAALVTLLNHMRKARDDFRHAARGLRDALHTLTLMTPP